MLYGFPKHGQNVQNAISVAPFFESYRDSSEIYIKVGAWSQSDDARDSRNIINFARNNAINYTVTIPWGPIIDVLIKAQIMRLDEYIAFPSHVDDYTSICQAMCHARSRMSKSAIKNVECIPTHCLLKVDYLLANNVNSSDESIITVATKGADITRRKRDRERLWKTYRTKICSDLQKGLESMSLTLLKKKKRNKPYRMKMSYWDLSKMGKILISFTTIQQRQSVRLRNRVF